MKKFITVFLLLLFQSISFAQLPLSGLMAWYPFCGNANDMSGNGHNLTVAGPTLTTDRFGSVGCAYYFPGNTIGINNSLHCTPPLPTDAADFTYSAWFEPDTIGNMQIVTNGDCDIDGYELTMLGNTCCSSTGNYVSIVFGGINMYLPTPVALHQWHQAVMRRIGNNFDLIIDTVLEGSFTGAFNPTNTSQDFGVGQNYVSGVCPFQGKIDDIAVYNRALSDAEISQLYHYDPVCATVATVTVTCDSISMPDTMYVCKNSTFSLPAILYGADSPSSIQWTPSTGLSNPDILNPTLTVGTTSGWYYLSVASLLPGNLVVNGDFSAGNTGFTSDYTYAATGPGALIPAGVYTITTDPSLDNPYVVVSFGDHTTGSGNMLAINGASSPIDVWCENITVTPNTYYDFSAWFADWSSDTGNSLPIIQFEINGALFGPVFNFPHPDGVWTQFSTTWYSGSNTSISLCINDQQTAAIGNDFAIDDISFQPLCMATDSIYIDVSVHDTIYNHDHISVCASNAPVTLTLPTGYNAYLWSNGSTAPSISVDSSGIYWANATGGSCGLYTDTFYTTVIPVPAVSLGNDTIICSGETIKLSVQQPGTATYKWNTGSTAAGIEVSKTGEYSVTVTQNGCSAGDSIGVNVITAPTVNLGSDTTLCAGYGLVLQVNAEDAKYLWSNGSTGQNIDISETGTYWVMVSNICGTASDTITANYIFCNIWFPSAFTPNGDGRNDIIGVIGSLAEYQDFSLSIYNRWGQRVFYTQDINDGWDGTFNGEKQPLGTYFYMIFYTIEGKKNMMKGDFQLIR